MSYLDSTVAVFPFDNALQSIDLNPVAIPPADVVYAVDLAVYITGTGIVKKYYATHGIYFDSGAGINYYEPRLKQPGNFQQTVFANGTTGGTSQVGFGEIVLINNDGGLDAFPTYGLDGRPVVLRKIIAGTGLILMSCSAEQPTPTWDTVPIRIKDKQQLFNLPIQPLKYLGTNVLPAGIEGVADIQGKPKPLLYGDVKNATPVCVNTSRLIFQGNQEWDGISGLDVENKPNDFSDYIANSGSTRSGNSFTFSGGSYQNTGNNWDFVRAYAGLLPGTSFQWIAEVNPNILTNLILTANNTVIWNSVSTAINFTVLPAGVWTTVALPLVIDANGMFNLHLGKSGQIPFDTIAQTSCTIQIRNVKLIRKIGVLQDIPAVYDKGVSLVRGANYLSAADIQANDPAPGTYRAYLAGGMFRLGSSPAGQITFDGIEGATVADRTAAQIAKRIALRGITSGEIDAADITALDTANSAVIGIYISEESTIAAALDEVINSVGAWYGFDSVGMLNMGRLEAPAGTPIVTLTTAEILSIERQATNDAGRGVPPYKVNLGYGKNNTVQDAGSLAGQISGLKWMQYNLPTSSNWAGIAYGNGLFVTVATGTNIAATSPDGIVWTQRTLPVTSNWNTIAYGNGMFVAVASGINFAATSPDGITWTQRTLPVTASWTYITWGGGRFVIGTGTVGDSVAYSSDGITWASSTMPSVNWWRTITYGNGIFVALNMGASGICATSPDGITWTQRSMPWAGVVGWETITYGNGLFVAFAQGSLGYAATSPDGITWTQRSMPTKNTWDGIAFGNGIFFATAYNMNFMAFSTDGITWTQSFIGVALKWRFVTFGNGSFAAPAFSTSTIVVFDSVNKRTLFLSKDYRTVTTSDAAILTKHPTAGELNINTLLAFVADATTEATRVLTLRKVDRDFLSVKVASIVLPADLLGKVLMIQIPRYGYDAGKLFVVMGVTYDYELGTTTLQLWG